MERYSEYKDSGIQWLGEIPKHWEIKQLRSFLKLYSEKGHGDAQLLSVTREQGVITRDKDNKEENHNYVPEDLSGYKYVEKGDFVINKMKAWQGSYDVSDYDGIVSPAYFTCKLQGVDKNFFSKAIRSKSYIGFFASYSKGIRVGQWDLEPEALKSIPFFLPPLPEQQKIVDFIESKTSNINAYVAERERELALLNELKEAEIANVVTRGLNPDVRMKDSGIPWIGMIPEHWSLRRIKYIFTELKEKSENGLETPLSLSKEEGIIPFSEKKNRTMESASYVGGKIVHKGEIVFNRFKARLFAISNYDGIVSSDYAVYKCNETASPEYIVKLFGTEMYREAFNRKASGIGDGFSRLYTDDLFAMYSIFPPLSEQQAIVTYIDQKCAKVSSLITELEAEIDYLKEYKQRLIADCVTGQVNVQNV